MGGAVSCLLVGGGGGGGRPKIFELKRGGIPKINEGRGVMLIYVPV